jgi:hypothetical protein
LFVNSDGRVTVGAADANDATFEIGTNGTGNKSAVLDLIGDTTYTDYGLRLIRTNSGANAASRIQHRGTGSLEFRPQEAAPILFFTNNSEIARFDSSGRLGLGTSSPGSIVDIKLNDTSTTIGGSASVARVNNGSGQLGATSGLEFFHGNDTSSNATRLAGVYGRYASFNGSGLGGELILATNTPGDATIDERMRIDSSGRVGIGTTSPSSLLHVEGGTTYINSTNAGGTSTPLQLSNAGSSGTSIVKLAFNNAGFTKASINAAVFGNDFLAFNVGSDTERARIDSSGRLLVGTSSARSTYAGNASVPLQVEGTNFSNSGFGVTRNSADPSGPAIFLGKTRSATLNGNNVVSSGDVVGTVRFEAADGAKLVQAAAISAAVDGTPGTDDMPGRLVFSTTADGASSPTERMRISSNGAVTISQSLGIGAAPEITSIGSTATLSFIGGAAAPRIHAAAASSLAHIFACLDVSGTIVTFRSQTTSVGSITVTGSATAYNTSSDYRLKENVVPLTGAADRLNQLQVHRFNFIADPDTTVDGFLAHEAQAVVPECVTGAKDEVDADGKPIYQGIDQSKLVPLLTAALQEALAKIETLESKVAALEGA